MSLPTIFDICEPREDVKKGNIQESDFAADLAQVLRGDAPEEYKDAAKFFANTHPTRGLKDLLCNVCLRLSSSSEQVSSIFRLDTQFGGGKTHALIALTHAANGMNGVKDVAEFIDPSILPKGNVRIAAFDGENADPANGRELGDGIKAFTPWGEIAYALNGKAGYERVRASDEQGVAPGAETLRRLFDGEPSLILIDELSIYLRKAKAKDRDKVGGQLTAFLTSLFKAVEGTKNAAVVYTLAIGKDGKAMDAYDEENQFIADKMAEAESISARKASLLNPTEEDETVKVIRRRLFGRIDDQKADQVVNAYKALWDANKDALTPIGIKDNRLEAFRNGYPLHPELMATLTNKTATLTNFQRVRGMLRLLARMVANLWAQRPQDAYAIHLHHVDPGFDPIRREIVTRLGQQQFVPAIRSDVASNQLDNSALAQEMDAQHYPGIPPYGSYVARSILFHSLAFNENLKGLTPEELRYSVVSPGTDISFVENARKRFVASSAYLDDRPNVPMRFLVEANLTQVIRRQEQQVDLTEVRVQLNDRIKSIFSGSVLELSSFPGGSYEVTDEVGNGKPWLVLIGYDADAVASDCVTVPPLVERIYSYKGSGTDLRINRNNLVFSVADATRKDEMQRGMIRRLALENLRCPERLVELAEHQRDRVSELYRRSEQELALAIQQCYRHVFYPSRNRVDGAQVDLAHSAIDVQSASEKPGDGQQQVIRILRDNNKLRMKEDNSDSPTYIRDRTPLKKGQISTLALRTEFRRDPVLPILADDEIFIKGIRQGVEQGEYVYKSGELLFGQGDPWTDIKIDEQSVVFTMSYAKQQGLWPRAPLTPELPPTSDPRSAIPEPLSAGPSPIPQPPSNQPSISTFQAEGVLKEALTKLWEQARAKKVGAIKVVTIRLFDASDAFRLLGAVNAISGAEKTVAIEGGYTTSDGGEMEMRFEGPVADAQPVKDFLDPQLRAAKEKDLTATFEVRFTDGLPLSSNAPEKMSERLIRFATGAAYVSATAEAKL